VAGKIGFEIEDAEALLNQLQQFHETVQQEWSRVENQWSNLQSIWRDSQYDHFEPQVEQLSSTYHEVEKTCGDLTQFLQNQINIAGTLTTSGLANASPILATGSSAQRAGGSGSNFGQSKTALSYESLIERGRQILGDRLVNVDRLLPDLSRAIERINELDENKTPYIDPAYVEALRSYLGIAQGTIAEMEAVRNSLTKQGLSEDEAKNLASKVNINIPGNSHLLGELRSNIQDFFQITKGSGSKSLKELVLTGDRAWATPDGKIGIIPYIIPYSVKRNRDDRTNTLWHEMGHHAEFENPELRNALANWVRSRATLQQQVSLRSLTGLAYASHEKAYPDHFIDPYVGKVYNDNSTEVLSMGLEHFVDAKSMLKLYRKDRDHFFLVVGAIGSHVEI
jgi:uncharacterized protein YukE